MRASPSRSGLSLRRVVLYSAVAVLLMLAWKSLLRGWADIYGSEARSYLDYWSERPRTALPLQDWVIARDALLQAQSLEPGHPDYHEKLGRLYAEALQRPGLTSTRRREFVSAGTEQARLSVKGRPAWPYAWLLLLYWKTAVRQVDAEFRLALERATTLGPWEASLQRSVIELGAFVWDRLLPEERKLVLQAGIRGLRQKPEIMERTLRKYGLLADVCREMTPANELYGRYCNALPRDG